MAIYPRMSSSSDEPTGGSVGGSGGQGSSKTHSETKLDDIARSIRRKLSSTPPSQSLATADHAKAVNRMLMLKDLLITERREDVFEDAASKRDAMMSLACAGAALQRRFCLEAEGALDEKYDRTITLLFILICMMAFPHTEEEKTEEIEATEATEKTEEIEAWESTNLETSIKIAAGVFCDLQKTSLPNPILLSPGEVCQICLKRAKCLGTSATMSVLQTLAIHFFRASSQSLMQSLLSSAPPEEAGGNGGNGGAGEKGFLSLSVLDFLAQADVNSEERLASIAECGESEAGQSALRDLILSFRLPRSVVGVRRTMLLGREANRITTESYSTILGEAHDAAMRGASWTWEKDADETHKMCALLAGVGIQLCANASSLRKDDAFQGRLIAPFFETQPPPPGATRMAFVEHTSEWVVFGVSKTNVPTVLLRAANFDGFLKAVLLFSSKIV